MITIYYNNLQELGIKIPLLRVRELRLGGEHTHDRGAQTFTSIPDHLFRMVKLLRLPKILVMRISKFVFLRKSE